MGEGIFRILFYSSGPWEKRRGSAVAWRDFDIE